MSDTLQLLIEMSASISHNPRSDTWSVYYRHSGTASWCGYEYAYAGSGEALPDAICRLHARWLECGRNSVALHTAEEIEQIDRELDEFHRRQAAELLGGDR